MNLHPENINVEGVILKNKPLSNYELSDAAKKLGIKNFRGAVCSDELKQLKKPRVNECGILNLDDSTGNGSHWVMWLKKGKDKIYFDSYGLHPPSEVTKYLNGVYYNSEQIQQGPTVFCGHICLFVLKKLQNSKNLPQDFQALINNLY